MSELGTVAQALAHARVIGIDRLDAQLLLAHRLGRPRAWLLAHGDTMFDAATQDAVCNLFARRAAGEPLAYLVGEREFHGLLLRVTPDVLIPRPDTETLVDWAIERLVDLPASAVLDLGTGSGAIALALKHAQPAAQVHGSDVSARALAVARANSSRLGLQIMWHLGDWWRAPDPNLRFDLVVANPPYIAPGDPHLAPLRHEPLTALVAQRAGLADIQSIVEGAPTRLAPMGWLLLEHGFDQAAAVCECLLQSGFEKIETRIDLGGQPRVSGGRLA